MNITDIGIGLAFLAGLVSFLSPCVFSLVPAYIGYLGGRSSMIDADSSTRRLQTLAHGIAFVLGFSLVFVFFGVTASLLGSFFYNFRELIAKVGGIIIIIFGIHMIGIYRLPFLEYDTRRQAPPNKRLGYLSSAMMGIFFSAGWSPCIGPVLGTILTFTINGGSVVLGAVLLSAYSAGLAIPFLVAAWGIGWVTTILKKYGYIMRYVEIGMGIVLVIVGTMLFFDIFMRLSVRGFFVDFGL
jgi:cytochrome c-type biogenesis protein